MSAFLVADGCRIAEFSGCDRTPCAEMNKEMAGETRDLYAEER